VLARNGALASMSRKGNCYDNAAMEAFFSTLKLELIYRQEPGSPEQTSRQVFQYLETFYNPRRRHSSLGYLSPAEFEAQPSPGTQAVVPDGDRAAPSPSRAPLGPGLGACEGAPSGDTAGRVLST
jgi:hypothetical protein